MPHISITISNPNGTQVTAAGTAPDTAAVDIARQLVDILATSATTEDAPA
ncbi:hypothetical protein ABC337_15165 [Arthrobacter sp. 1P04PC]